MGPNAYDFQFNFNLSGGVMVTFEPSDEDSTGDIQYYGYLSQSGSWVMMKIDRSVSPYTYRYLGGKTYALYLVSWAARATGLSWVTYDKLAAQLQ